MLNSPRNHKSAPRPPPGGADPELERAVDTVAAILRAFGRHSFDLPDEDSRQTAELCERWATHLLLLSPSPTARSEDARDGKPESKRRDWVSARQYFVALRTRERAYLGKMLRDLRDTVWAFVHALNQALSGGGEADSRVTTQLSRLKSAAQGGSTDELKREAMSVAATIGEILVERRKTQAKQVSSIGERMVELNRALDEARREAAIDPLTKLYNRKMFDEELMRTVDLGGLFRQRACLLLVDIDHLKAVNDAHGHPMGDEVLRKVSECLVRTFRRRDDVVARYDGEEFAVILRETHEKEAVLLCDRLLECMRSLVVEQTERSVRITISFGVAELDLGETADSWVARTLRALGRAKSEGRDRFVVAPRAPPA